VTTVVLLATAAAEHGPAAAQPWRESTVLRRLLDQLASVGVEAVHVITRPGWEARLRPSIDGVSATLVESATPAGDVRAVAEIARGGSGGLLVGYGDIVTHREALAGLLGDPRVPSGILASADPGGRPSAWGVRTDRGRVLSVASPYHSVGAPNHAFLGLVKVAPGDRSALVTVAERMAQLADEPPAAWLEELHRKRAGPEDVTALLTVGLVRSGVQLSQSFLRELFWARPLSDEELRLAGDQIGSYDEQQVVLDSAVKATDGFFTTFFVSPYSKYIARWAARRGLTPNQVTTASMAVGVATAAAFATGERWGMVAGALLLQLAFTLDCVDGQLARYTMTFTKFGAWLDSVFDRAKEYVVYAGLAIGSSRAGDPVWLLAGAALTLQTVRHALDFSYAASEQHAMAAAPQRPLDDPWDGAEPAPDADAAGPVAAPPRPAAAPPQPLPARVLASWRRLNRMPGLIWVKRVAVFPIGERFAAVSLTAALFTPRTTFVVLLACGGLAALYGLAGRLLRSMR
jgi:phosphatidylglycerophosphate synthase